MFFFSDIWNKQSDSPAIEKNEIQTHNFENAKNALKKFSKNIPSSVNLPTVPTSSWIVFDHDVSGSELNKLTNQVQKCLIDTNNHLIQVIKEFDQVYQTFEALDKDYIQGLIAGNKAAEVASNQAMKAATKAFEAIEESKKNTNDIENLLKTQHIIIDKLVAFKERIENIPNIDNVSTMWKDIQYFKSEILDISDSIHQSQVWASEADKLIREQELTLSKIVQFKKEFEAIPHIRDLKIIWDDLQNLNNQVPIISAEIAANEAVTKDRFAVQDQKISFQSEKLASLINTYKSEFYEELTSLSKKQSQQFKDFTNQIEIIQNEIIKNESSNEQRFAIQNTQFFKKIKIAYMIAGVSVAITLTHVVLSALGIL